MELLGKFWATILILVAATFNHSAMGKTPQLGFDYHPCVEAQAQLFSGSGTKPCSPVENISNPNPSGTGICTTQYYYTAKSDSADPCAVYAPGPTVSPTKSPSPCVKSIISNPYSGPQCPQINIGAALPQPQIYGAGGITVTSINGVPVNPSSASPERTNETALKPSIPDWSWYPLSTDLSSYATMDDPVFYKNIDGKVSYTDAIASKQLIGADSSSFQFAYDKNYSMAPFGKDDAHVYWENKPLPLADPSTFTPMFDLNGTPTSYGKDVRNVYYLDTPVQGVERTSFVALSSRYGKDKNNAYYKNGVILGADASTFEVVEENSCVTFAKDKFHVYTGAEIMKKADPATFRGIPIFHECY
jgi:hypothetical protein